MSGVASLRLGALHTSECETCVVCRTDCAPKKRVGARVGPFCTRVWNAGGMEDLYRGLSAPGAVLPSAQELQGRLESSAVQVRLAAEQVEAKQRQVAELKRSVEDKVRQGYVLLATARGELARKRTRVEQLARKPRRRPKPAPTG